MKRRNPEYQLHKAIVQYLSIFEKQGKLFFFAVPNQGGRGLARRGAMLRAMGVKAGIPDLVVITPDRLCGSRVEFIELKSEAGRASKSQLEISDRLIDWDYQVHVIRSLDGMASLLKSWGIVK